CTEKWPAPAPKTPEGAIISCMVSLVTHALGGTALGKAATPELRRRSSFWFSGVMCVVMPDFEVLGFAIGVNSGDPCSHRVMTHPVLFAIASATLLALCLQQTTKKRWKLGGLLFVIAASHGVLDALTNGGRGVAFFSPFDRRRYFFPWRPIQVSPIGA